MNLFALLFTLLVSPSIYAQEAARVNDKIITQDQVTARVNELSRSGMAALANRKSALDELIKRELAIQEAKKLKLDQDPVVLERMNNVLYFALLDKQLSTPFEKITISDAEAKNWYEKNPEIRTSQIFVAVAPDASNEAEKAAIAKLTQILSDVKTGKTTFAEAAQNFSEDPSAAMGGDLDYRMRDRLEANYYNAAIKLTRVGETSAPIRSPFGFHLIRLTGKKSWNEVDRSRVKRILLEEKRQNLVNQYLNDLKKKAKISLN